MEKNGKVSVVIPTYNRAKLLPRAIESVLRQTHPADELIVVDDGSTDETAELIKSFEARGVRYVRKENGGVSSARNKGLQLVQNEYVAFLDSDDEWLSDMLEKTIPLLESYPSAGVVFADAAWMDEEKVVEPAMNWGPRRQAFGKLLGIKHGFSGCIDRSTFRRASFQFCLMLQSAVVFRAELFDTIGGYNEDYRVSEDYELWLRLSRVCDVVYVDRPLVNNYFHGENLSGTAEYKNLFIRNNRQALKSELAVEQDRCFREEIKQNIRDSWESEILLWLQEGNLKRSDQTLIEARADGWRATEQSMRRLKVVDCFGTRAGLLLCRLLRLVNRL